jgi:CIC family chloride channel protein
MNVEEIVIEPGSACAGHRVREIEWPRDCILASVRRGRRVIIPRGDTMLWPEDVLVAVAEGEAGLQLRRLCLAAESLPDEPPGADLSKQAG